MQRDYISSHVGFQDCLEGSFPVQSVLLFLAFTVAWCGGGETLPEVRHG